jgi:hypothetical protein
LTATRFGNPLSTAEANRTFLAAHDPSTAAEPLNSFHYYKWYASMAIFSELGVARLLGINGT